MTKTKNKPKNQKEEQFFDLTIREVKDMLPPIPMPRAIDPRLPTIPGVFLSIMKVKSGKSNLMVNMMLGENFYGGPVPIFDIIYIISPTIKIDKSSQPFMMEELEDRVVIFDDMPRIDSFLRSILDHQEEFDIKDPDNLPPTVAIVMDDISGFLKRNSNVSNLFTRYRHYNISLFCSNQVIRGLPTEVRSQATSVWLSSCYSTVERDKLFEEYADKFDRGWKGKSFRLEHMWDYCCEERFNYCYLKLDDVAPRIFKIGCDGIEEIDWMNWHNDTPVNESFIDDDSKIAISTDEELLE